MMKRHEGHGKSRPRSRLLVVDDDPFYREMATAMLDEAGYEVLAVEDGLKGLEILRATHIDIAVIDLTMPGADGYEVIRRTRAQGHNPALPLIVMTGQEDVATLEKAFEAGATSFVAKPLNWPLFVHHVHYVGRAARLQAELRDTIRTAEFLSNLKGRVLSVLVGESQGPLRTAQGMTELLCREVHGPLGQRIYNEFARDIQRALDRLGETHAKMLNSGRVLASDLLLEEEAVPLADLMREAVDAVRDKADARYIEVDTRLDAAEGLQLLCDRSLINQALRLVIESAVTNSPRHSSVSIDARHDESGSLSFAVVDEAPALPRGTVREILADGPQEAQDSPAIAARNTSLGICRVIVEAHEGRLAISTTSEEGTCVRLILPAHRLLAAGQSAPVRAKAPAARKADAVAPPPALRVNSGASLRLPSR